ncbi:pyridoxal phosphate-dependent decarboxylase family protein [Alienimonas chondri]|uniref:L-2,4-diaminobutyrate decarboxylase n=1 Tax=Alienimonas chondri TaxID=2681879 RepID=A0ABX1VHE6_9PLAN|nr:aminotransferase class I/II-fold pyridoxal phosphate-dependent enzyme [Alienimonas chondri]NNJ27506.1 L-2,4-diaminobutyrate decarboxylase [Alienimonas chondri]
MSPPDSLAAARARIAPAYDAGLFRDSGHAVSDALADHLAESLSGEGPVLNWNAPADNIAAATAALRGEPVGSNDEVADRVRGLVGEILKRGQNLHSPRYIGHQVPASVPIAGLFDAVGSVTNQPMAIYEMGPFASAAEEACVAALGEKLGFDAGSFAGFVTHGGSLANTTCLLTARNVLFKKCWEEGVPRSGPQPVLVAHGESHYCIARSAGLLGLGTRNVIKAELNDRRQIDPSALDETLTRLRAEGVPIVAVAAGACATPIGAFDDLNAVADVCEKHGVWMHVDAAHGGAAAFSPTHKHLLDGVERADSVIWDAHKMLFVPALCAFVFYKNREHRFEAFRQDAPYLFDPSDPGLAEHDSGMKTLECTKRAAALGLWGTWATFGEQLFTDLVDVTFALTRSLYEKLNAAADFEPLNDPQCNIVAFRYVPACLRDANDATLGRFQQDLRRDLVRSGRFYIVPTAKDGVPALRCTVMNPLTTEAHLDELLNELRTRGRALSERR